MDGERSGSALLHAGERLDDLGCEGLRIIQHPALFRFTTDAYLLAAFARPRAGDRALELGSGNGAVVLLLAARTKAARVVGLEIQPALVEMAGRSIILNGLEQRAEVRQGDLRHEDAVDDGPYDMVASNPPHITAYGGNHSHSPPEALAKHEIACTLRDVIQAGARWLRDQGRFVLVHRPARLPEILAEMRSIRLAPKKLALIHPRPGRAAGILLLEARRGARPGLEVAPPIFVRDAAGCFTTEMEEVFAGRWPFS